MTATGGTGKDTIIGGAGDDTITGGTGADILDGAAGTADVVSYSDILSTGTNHGIANSKLIGVAVNMTGSAIAKSVIDGALTAATYTTFSNAAVAAGKVNYILDGASDTGGGEIDTISNFESVVGSARSDYIATAATDTTVDGGAGIDFILGAAGDDNLTGGAGADIITGGAGLDTLTGSAGSDIFHLDKIASSASIDTITDFTTTADKINVNASLTDGNVALASSAFTAHSGSATAGNNEIVNLAQSSALADAAAAVALFEASSSDSSKMVLASGSEVIFVVQDDDATSGTDFDAQIFMVDNTGGTIGATQIAIVSLTAADSAVIVVGDFV
jgi:Ca2+-binding RTX toxin-like protein